MSNGLNGQSCDWADSNVKFYEARRAWLYQGKRYDDFSWFQEMMTREFWENASGEGYFTMSELPVPFLDDVVEVAKIIFGFSEMFEVFRIKMNNSELQDDDPVGIEAENLFMLFQEYIAQKPNNITAGIVIRGIFKKWAMQPDLYSSINDEGIIHAIENDGLMRKYEENT